MATAINSTSDSYFLTLERRDQRLTKLMRDVDEETERYDWLMDRWNLLLDTIAERPAHGPEGMAVKLRFLREDVYANSYNNRTAAFIRTLSATAERMAAA